MNRRRAVAVGVGAGLVLVAVAVAVLGVDRPELALVSGVFGGVPVGLRAGRYDPAMRDGLYAGGVGAVAVAVAGTVYAVNQSLSAGYGIDSGLTLLLSAPSQLGALLGGPVVAVQAALAAVCVQELRIQFGSTSERVETTEK